MEEEGEEGGEEGVEDVKGLQVQEGFCVEGDDQGSEGQAEDRNRGVTGREEFNLRRRGLDGERGGVVPGRKGRVDQIVAFRIRVPEQSGGFLAIRAIKSFGLQVSAGVAVEAVIHGDRGGLV